ncbi:hypothetical protein [Nonomuraea angiospora]|uniref:hypothetical protein n=1 Tax=Nonomuraea angiospora TaxID=46172 RepID=UPI0029AB0F66|nr:hypothetical protein [Nonomuraea angiospora]MDX3110682.1 hypothetical protein [Nonomuraea angiospora]
MMLIGNPLAGAATAPETLPGWSGVPGQLLRSTTFFDGRGVTHSVIVLVTWLTLGIVPCLAGGLRAPCRHRCRGPSQDGRITGLSYASATRRCGRRRIRDPAQPAMNTADEPAHGLGTT